MTPDYGPGYRELQAKRRATAAERSAWIEAALNTRIVELEQARDAALERAGDLEDAARERDAALARAADLENVARERDAADQLCRTLREQLGTAMQRIATLQARLDRAPKPKAPARPPARPEPCQACARAGQEVEALRAQLQAEQSLKSYFRVQRDEALQHVKDLTAQLRATGRATAEPAEPGPFVLQRDTGRRLVWWTGQIAGGQVVTSTTSQAAHQLLTRAEAEAWLGQCRALSGFRIAAVPQGPSRQTSLDA